MLSGDEWKDTKEPVAAELPFSERLRQLNSDFAHGKIDRVQRSRAFDELMKVRQAP